ncbi:MAG TPA: winged helix-turn-helix domain-containing protein [Caulobacteraceae bacterium]|nr:winged helix-turn-helix domain-containing protein [Caulobacteraceae bacterium]
MDVSVREGKRYEFGAFVLDPVRRVVTRRGAPVLLTPTLFDTLLYLVEHPGRAVSKEELLDAVWPSKTVNEANISQTIFTLRRALAAAGEREPLIVTAPGVGYRFAHPVRVIQDGDAYEPPAIAPARAPIAGARAFWPIPLGWTLAGLVALAAAALATTLALWRPSSPPAAPTSPNLVVVGDFQNLTADRQLDRTFQVATQIDLMQSPFFQVLSDEKVQDTLALMTRPRDAALTPALAREVCARNNGVAALDGVVAQVGSRYLLTLTAADCPDGGVVAAEKVEIAQRDGLLPALDDLVGRMRSRLGESAASIRRFGFPLLQRRTASLEALEAYSQAVNDTQHGKRIDAIPLFKQAIAIDPNFASAYSDLSVVYNNVRQDDLAAAMITKAYALRDTLGERERFYVLTRRNAFVTGDIPEELRIYASWTQVYPNDGSAWANLSNKQNWVGRYPEAIVAGRRALALEPNTETAYVVLARALLHAGRLDEARAICAQAAAHGVDGDDLHGLLFQIAVVRDDPAGQAQQLAWAQGKPGERTLLIDAGQAAYSRGEIQRGEALFARALDLGKPFGLGNIFSAPNARLLEDLGRHDLAIKSLADVPAGYDSPDYRFALAEIGDAARADALLSADIKRAPTNTLLTQVFASEQRAVEALQRGQPAAAIAALEPARPYEMRTFDIPFLRGQAYLAAGDGARAAIEFRKILGARGVEAVSSHYALSQLGLARALRLQHNVTASRAAYEQFFRDWRDADPDMPLLAAARREYAALRG